MSEVGVSRVRDRGVVGQRTNGGLGNSGFSKRCKSLAFTLHEIESYWRVFSNEMK